MNGYNEDLFLELNKVNTFMIVFGLKPVSLMHFMYRLMVARKSGLETIGDKDEHCYYTTADGKMSLLEKDKGGTCNEFSSDVPFKIPDILVFRKSTKETDTYLVWKQNDDVYAFRLCDKSVPILISTDAKDKELGFSGVAEELLLIGEDGVIKLDVDTEVV